MNFNEYQEWAKSTDVFKVTKNVTDSGYIAKILGLTGEAGEVADKFKKIVRDKKGKVSDIDKEEIIKELGDVLWYVATIARYMGVSFNEVAEKNIVKIEKRKANNRIHGSGDNR